MKMNGKYFYLVVVIVILNILDIINTYEITGGIPAEEVNVIMAFFMEYGYWCMVAAKFVFISFGLFIIYRYRPVHLYWICGLYSAIVSYQLFVIYLGVYFL